MNIIENPNPRRNGISVCNECKCKFSYLEADIHKKSWNDGEKPKKSSSVEEYVICPNCRNWVNIEKDKK